MDWLVDVSIGRQAPARGLDDQQPFGLGVSIMAHGELLEGVYGYPDTTERVTRIQALLNRFEPVPLANEVLEIFGQTRSELRRAGQLVADLDPLIGAPAIAPDLIVLTRNTRHFSRIPRLQPC